MSTVTSINVIAAIDRVRQATDGDPVGAYGMHWNYGRHAMTADCAMIAAYTIETASCKPDELPTAITNLVVDDLIRQGYILPEDDCDDLRHSVECIVGGALDVKARLIKEA